MATIDERIVEMRFDNKDFEKNVQTSLKTIDKLKESLDFDDATKSLDDLQDAARHFSLDDIGQALNDLSDKFNWENVFKIDLLRRAIDLVEGEIKRAFSKIQSTLQLDSVDWVNNAAAGWNKFAEKTNSVATIMAATGQSMEVVNEQMERLLYFSDETSYSFTDMAGNIGKFTANGVDLEIASSAMQGIATWAARSGQEAGTASRVMYNLSQAIGMGALKLQDWKSVELANMGTKEFKEMAIQAGLATGTLKEYNGQVVTAGKGTAVAVNTFRDTLAEGWLDTETLLAVLGEYGKAADLISQLHDATGKYAADLIDMAKGINDGSMGLERLGKELGYTGAEFEANRDTIEAIYEDLKLLGGEEYEFSVATYQAAQEARTFGQAMDAVADAVSSNWMTTFELLFGQYEDAKVLWTDLAENLIEIFGAGASDRNETLQKISSSGWDDLTASIQAAGVSLVDFEEALIKESGFRRRFLENLMDKNGYESFTDLLLSGALGVDESVDIVKRAIDSLEGSGTTIADTSKAIGLSYEEIDAYGVKIREGVYGWYTSEEQVQRIMAENADITEEQAKMLVKYAEASHSLHRSLTEEEFKEWLLLNDIELTQDSIIEGSEEWKELAKQQAEEMYRVNATKAFREGLINFGHIAVDVFTQVREIIKELIPPVTAERLAELATGFRDTTANIRNFLENSETFKNIIAVVIGPIGFLLQVLQGVAKVAMSFIRIIGVLLTPVGMLVSFIGWIIRQVNELTGGFNPILAILEGVSRLLNALTGYVQKVINVVAPIVKGKLLSKIEGPLGRIKEKLDAFRENKLNIFNKWIENLEKKDPTKAGKKIVEVLSSIWNFFRNIKNNGFKSFSALFGGTSVGKFFSDISNKFSKFKHDVDVVSGALGIGKLSAAFMLLKAKAKPALDTIVGSVSKFTSKFKNTAIGQVFSDISNKFGKFKHDVDVVSGALGISKLSAAFMLLKAKVVEVFGSMSDSVSNFTSKFKEGAIGQFFTGILNKLKSFKRDVDIVSGALGIGKLSAAFMLLKAKASQVFENLKDKIFGTSEAGLALRAKFESLGETFGAIKDKIVAKLTEIKNAILAWISGEKIDFSSIFNFQSGDKTLLERFAEIKEKILSLFKGNEEGEGGIFSNLFGEDGFDFSKLFKGGAIVGGLALIAKLFTGIKRTQDAVSGKDGGAALGNFAEGISPFADTINELKTALSGFSILKFAVAMVALAWALSKLGELSASGMGVTLGTLGGALVEFIGTFAILSKVLGGKNGVAMIKIGLGMLAITLALRSFAKAIEAFQNLKFESVKDVVKVLAILFLAVKTLTKLAKKAGKFDFKFSNGMGLIAAAAALWLFGKVLNSYTKLKINSENVVKVLGGLLLAVVVMSRLAKVVGKNNFKFSNGLALITLALSLSIFANVVKRLGKIENGILVKGLIAISVLSLIVGLLISSIAEPLKGLKLTNAISGLLLMAGLLVMMVTIAGLCYILGKNFGDGSVIGAGAFAVVVELAVIILAMKLLVKSLEGFKLGSAIGGLIMMIGMIALLVAFSAAIVVLGEWGLKNPEAYARGLIALAVIIGAFLAVALVFKHASTGKLVVAIIGLIAAAAAMWVAVLAIEKLSKIDGKKAMEGVKAIGLLLAEFMAMATANTFLPILAIGEIATVAFMKQLADAIEPLVTQLGVLSDMHPENVAKGLENIKAIFEIFFDLAKRLTTNVGLYGQATQAAELAKIFGESLRPLCDDTAILGGTDPVAAAANLEVVKGLINLILDLAQTLSDNSGLYAQATLAAGLAQLFGLSLRPLCDDTAILGGTNPENAAGSLEVVRGLIDTMLELAQKLIDNSLLFVAGMAASTLAKAFGEGLEQLCQDVVILGSNASAETSTASVETVRGLIDTMVDLATLLNDNTWLFAAAQLASIVAGQFGEGLKTLCEDTVILGDNTNAQTSLESVRTVWALIQVMCSLAEKLNKNSEILASAQDAAGVADSFGKGLKQLCTDVEILGKANINNTSGNLDLLITILGKMFEIATAIRDDTDLYEAGLDACKMVKKFGGSLILLVGEVFALSKVSGVDAVQTDGEGNITGGGFAAVAAIIDYMLALAEKISADEGLFDKATKAATMCQQFGEGLAFLTAEAFVSQFIKAENSATVGEDGKVTGGGFAATAAIIDYMIELSKKFAPGAGITFTMASNAASACKSFGEGLKGLVVETFALGFVKAANAEASFRAIQTMLDYLILTAWKFNANPALFDKAKEMSDKGGILREFARALAGLVVDVLLASFTKATNVDASVKAMIDLVTMLTDLATTINSTAGMKESLESAVSVLSSFGKEMDSTVAVVQGLSYDTLNTDTLQKTLNAIQGFVTGIAEIKGDVASAAIIMPAIADMFSAIENMARFSNILTTDWFEDDVGKITKIVSESIANVANTGTNLDAAATAIAGIDGIFSTFADIVSKSGNESEFTSSISEFLSGADKMITQAITDMQEAMAKIDFTGFDTAISGLKTTTLESMLTFGSDILENISLGVENNTGRLSTALVGVMKTGTATINAWYNSYYNAGYYVMVGFNNGIVSMANTIYNNVRTIANGVINILNSIFRIDSPSRVFAEIGEYTMLGLAKGIEDTSESPLNSVENLGNSLVTAMQNAMAYANEADYGVMPTITPVMDMGQMSNQSSMLKAAMGNFDLRGMMANARIDGATINNSIQSKDIIAEIRQLNEKLAIMDENLQNMQLVLDTGALVGGTSAAMDNQFGKMAMRRGRGN